MSDDGDDLDGIDNDTGDDGGGNNQPAAGDGEPAVDEHGNVVCPECGESFETKVGLGVHRKREHGIESKRRRRRKRDKTDPAPNRKTRGSSGRKQKIKETLEEVAALLDELQGQGAEIPDRLADILRMDADKLAGFLAFAADRVSPFGLLVDSSFGRGGPLAGVRAFWRVIGWLTRRVRENNKEARAYREEFTRLYNAELDARGPDAAEQWRAAVERGEIVITA